VPGMSRLRQRTRRGAGPVHGYDGPVTLRHYLSWQPLLPMIPLKYLQAYPAALQEQVRQMIAQERLGEYLRERYSQRHDVQSDKALYSYAQALKQEHLRNAPNIDKVLFDNRLDLTHRALGLHTAISRVQGGKLKAKKEIRIASLFREADPQFLRMIVVHELAHLKESDHNKAFYQLCEYMQPGYQQLEFDLRLFLTHRDLPVPAH
jgi:predicted metal-dependent hydrolase